MWENKLILHSVIAVGILLASALLGRVIKMVLNVAYKFIFRHTTTTLDDRILDVIKSKVVSLTVLGGCYVGLYEVRKAFVAGEVLGHQVLDYAKIILFFALVVILTRLASRIIGAMFEWYMEEELRESEGDLKRTVAPLAMKVVNIVLSLVALIIVLDHFSINIGSLLLSLGVGSLAVALAAQETVANMIAGFVILADRPFHVGDRIRLQSGEEGDVHEIGLRSTRLLNYDGNFLIIPNSELVKSRIINFASPDPATRAVIELSVAYGTNIEKTKSLLIGLAEGHPDVSSSVKPEVLLVHFVESGVQLRLTARVELFKKRMLVEATLREQIYSAFADAGIQMSYPHRVIHMVTSGATEAPQKK